MQTLSPITVSFPVINNVVLQISWLNHYNVINLKTDVIKYGKYGYFPLIRYGMGKGQGNIKHPKKHSKNYYKGSPLTTGSGYLTN